MKSNMGKKHRPEGKIKKRQGAPGRKKPGKKLVISLICVFAVGLILAAVLIWYFALSGQQKTAPEPEPEVLLQEPEEQEAPEPELGGAVVDHIITAGNAVDEAYRSRPKSYELTGENAAQFATIEECRIEPDTGRIAVTAAGDGIPVSDDKYYYLFALDTYENEIGSEDEAIAREYKDSVSKFTAALNYNRSGSRLFKKFVVAVKKDGQFVRVSGPKYITNPEAIARFGSVYQTPASIKGLLVDPNRMRGGELDDLGVKQAAYNIPVARLLGPTTSSVYIQRQDLHAQRPGGGGI